MNYVFWQNIISPHQAALLQSLARGSDVRVTLVVARRMSRERAEVGWREPDLSGVDIVVSPEPSAIRKLIAEHPTDAVHVFSGVSGDAGQHAALVTCIHERRRVGIMAEPGNLLRSVGWARLPYHYWQHALVRRGVDFVLAIGAWGPKWYRWCGYEAERIYQFGYAVNRGAPREPAPDTRHAVTDGRVEVAFVGRLVWLKRVDLLIRALAASGQANWHLRIIGDGPERASLVGLASQLGVANRIHWWGVMPNDEIQLALAQVDLLVLPSGWDGWGVVINEALMQGCCAISSDRCGASVLLASDWRGAVFRANSVDQLQAALTRYISAGRRTDAQRSRIIGWTRRIEGQALAEYFNAIVESVYGTGPRPTPPWFRTAE